MKQKNTPNITEGNPLDLLINKILYQTPPQKSDFKITRELDSLNNTKEVDQDKSLFLEHISDLQSNRTQRESFTKQILVVMCLELFFTALLIFGVFITPFVNSLAPRISFNLPPLFLTITITCGYIYLYRQLKKYDIKSNNITKIILTILYIIFLNYFARENHVICFERIYLSENIINMILYTALAIFIKTTVLAGYIINGLYEALKQENHKSIKSLLK